jgi:hypothetical protein
MPDIPGYRIEGPSVQRSSDSSVHFDYSGLDQHLKQQDELAKLRNAKYQQLYAGDVAGSVAAAQRIRDLLAQLQANAPATTEDDPYQISNALRRISAISSGEKSDFDSGAEERDGQDSYQAQVAKQIQAVTKP